MGRRGRADTFHVGLPGLGSATRELIGAVEATERKRRFKPPIFFDIRYRRSVPHARHAGLLLSDGLYPFPQCSTVIQHLPSHGGTLGATGLKHPLYSVTHSQS